MNTSLFSNMFKSLFGEQITPTSSQFVPITASDGTPAGISSMTDLQSVLGDGRGNAVNPDTTLSPGTYYFTDGSFGGALRVWKADGFTFQNEYVLSDNPFMRYRFYNKNTQSWSEWKNY